MTSKATVYIVLAVAIGYLLVSSFPIRFETMTTKEVKQLGDTNRSYGFSSGGEQAKGSEEDRLLAPEVTASGAWDWSTLLGFLVVDLSIALGVYFIVKRHLS